MTEIIILALCSLIIALIVLVVREEVIDSHVCKHPAKLRYHSFNEYQCIDCGAILPLTKKYTKHLR